MGTEEEDMNKFRIAFISDPHGYHKSISIPKCDLLICSGDLTSRGEISVFESFNEWVGELKRSSQIKECILTLGNHDLSSDSNFIRYYQPNFRSYFSNCILLMNESCEFEGLKIYGSPHTLQFGSWAHMYDRKDGDLIWDQIPNDTQILITHGPPHTILDQTSSGDLAGCESLYKKIRQLPSLLVHCFGHIHEAYGTLRKGDQLFVNASSCTLRYNPTNLAIVIDLWERDGYWYKQIVEKEG
jgi:Icc-related predicted phosphoesterase